VEALMKLQEQIENLNAELSIRIPAELLREAKSARVRLIESGSGANALKAGDQAPAFSLPNTRGETVVLEDVLKRGPTVLSFYRGGWCEYCNLELRALQDALEQNQRKLVERGASLLAISPQTSDRSQATVEKNHLTFDVLCDAGNETAREYGLVYALDDQTRNVYTQFGAALPAFNGDESWEIPHPATYVVGSDGIISWAFVNADYTKRAEPDEVIKELEAL
jgi:peroxiredoxin